MCTRLQRAGSAAKPSAWKRKMAGGGGKPRSEKQGPNQKTTTKKITRLPSPCSPTATSTAETAEGNDEKEVQLSQGDTPGETHSALSPQGLPTVNDELGQYNPPFHLEKLPRLFLYRSCVANSCSEGTGQKSGWLGKHVSPESPHKAIRRCKL